MKVLVAPATDYAWIAEKAQLVLTPQFRALEAVDGEKIVGMVGFDGFTPNALSLHIALENPYALLSLAKIGFQWAFKMRAVAIAPVISTNKRSIRLVEGLGFKPCGRLKDAWMPGVDLCFYEMRRDECRFLKEAERWAA